MRTAGRIAFLRALPARHCRSRIRRCGRRGGVRRPHRAAAAMGAVATLGARFVVSTAINGALYIGASALGQRLLTTRALLHALVLGVLLGTTVGASGWGMCASLFLVGSAATRAGRATKEAAGIAEPRGGARAPAQVWGAAGAAAICAALSALAALLGSQLFAAAFRLAYACAIAAKMSDTAASEIGKAYGRNAFLVSSLKRVPPGTDGAVSVQGTVAGVAAACLAAVYAANAQLCSGATGACIVVAAATLATTAESFIGALWQKRYALSNELVNFLQTALAALFGLLVSVAGAVAAQ